MNISPSRAFTSDNNASVHPAVMAAINVANHDHVIAYGHDSFTRQAEDCFKAEFGDDIAVFFVFNGTAANTLSLRSLVQSHHAVLCANTAHVNNNECGAPEKMVGCKLIGIPAVNGKISAEDCESHLSIIGNEHFAQPKAISITQLSELGTTYQAEEIRVLADLARNNNLYLHMDGARIANAAASLGCSLRAITRDVGVDVLSFGGTKNGLLCGEAIVFFNAQLSEAFKFIRKQHMQLASKMRFISAQFEALLTDELWRKNALHANKMAQLLAEGLLQFDDIKLQHRVDGNIIHVHFPSDIIQALQEKFYFYVRQPELGGARLVCAFDTTPEDVQNFIDTINVLKK